MAKNYDFSEEMIDGQLTPHNITEPKLLAAFASVSREDFMLYETRNIAYIDGAHDLGGGRYMMPPLVVAQMLQLAELNLNDTVLVLGGGTGYMASLAAKLSKHVYAVEENQELSSKARSVMQKKSIDNIDIVSAPPVAGYAEQAPYDVVLIGGSVEHIPENIFEQLSDGGKMIFVKHAGQKMTGINGVGYLMVCKRIGERFEVEEYGEYSVPLLSGFDSPSEFMF